MLGMISFTAFRYAHAQTDPASIQAKIDQRSADIQALQKEIDSYQSQIDTLSGQESSLSDAVKSLDLTQKKLQADISVTEDKIDATNLKIQSLATQIGTTKSTITDDTRYVAESFKNIGSLGQMTLPQIFLSSISISDALNNINTLATVESGLMSRIKDLNDARTSLETNKTATEAAKADLVKLESQLTDQRKVVLSAQTDKNQLLSDTKDSEANYQKILADKQAEQEAFEQEFLQYQSQLKLSVDLSKLPPTGSAVLSWPVDMPFITQYFGNTPFATANPQVYKGFGHNGVDFRASIGTSIKAALSGVVAGEGNTDLTLGCYSFGKWIMLKHADGLSTLYAHLSLQTVSLGDTVTTGQLIGYSGNTGYTTGPHLHFGVYATAGVEIEPYTSSINCHDAVIPIAALPAYLNPLSYLPSLPN